MRLTFFILLTFFLPFAIITSSFEFFKKSFIFWKSLSVSSAPFLTQSISPKEFIFSDNSSVFTSVFVTSERILPSFNSIILSPYSSAKSLSWETTTISLSRESFFRVSNTCLPVAESSAPVGSSAIIISGDFISARAIAILCFWPPESVFGLRLEKPSKSTSLSNFLIAFLSLGFPCNSSANAILSSTENSSKILYSWKTKPTKVFL